MFSDHPVDVLAVPVLNRDFIPSAYDFAPIFRQSHAGWDNTAFMVQNTLTRKAYSLIPHGSSAPVNYDFRVALCRGSEYKDAYGHHFTISHIQDDLTPSDVNDMKYRH